MSIESFHKIMQKQIGEECDIICKCGRHIYEKTNYIKTEFVCKECYSEFLNKGSFNKSGSKYIRKVKCLINKDSVDVYSVLDAFNVTCPGRQHAIKKLLCAGLRKKGSEINDLIEAKDAIERAIQMAESKLEDENRNGIV